VNKPFFIFIIDEIQFHIRKTRKRWRFKMSINCNDPLVLSADLFCDEPMDIDTIEAAVKNILSAIGEDVEREGLERTPHRVANSYNELLAGYRMDPRELINDAIFDVAYDPDGHCARH
jgi:hypothetical protein